MGSMRKRAQSLAEYILRNNKAIAKAIEEAREVRSHKSGGDGTGHARVEDTTAMCVINKLHEISSVRLDDGTVIKRPEVWLKIVRYLYKNAPRVERDAMGYYYNGYSVAEVAHIVSLSEHIIYRIRDDFRESAIEIACQYGLIRVADIHKD